MHYVTDDDWKHPYFQEVGHPEILRLAEELGCGTFKVYHASGAIELGVKHEKIRPQTWDLAEFKRLVEELILEHKLTKKPNIMATIDDEDIPF